MAICGDLLSTASSSRGLQTLGRRSSRRHTDACPGTSWLASEPTALKVGDVQLQPDLARQELDYRNMLFVGTVARQDACGAQSKGLNTNR
jgi:hypothetical protein